MVVVDFETDYYAILGLENSATSDDIKKAYRVLAKKYHPDVNTKSNASDIFNAISEAYEVLSDPKSRTEYDLLNVSRGHFEEREMRAREVRFGDNGASRRKTAGISMPAISRAVKIFLLSVIVPGLVHIDAGERKTGSLLFAGYFTLMGLALVYGMEIGILSLIVWAATLFDAYLLIKRGKVGEYAGQ